MISNKNIAPQVDEQEYLHLNLQEQLQLNMIHCKNDYNI